MKGDALANAFAAVLQLAAMRIANIPNCGRPLARQTRSVALVECKKCLVE